MSSTMSGWSVRKPVRTYSRQNKHSLRDQEPPTKRRRVDSTRTSVERTAATEPATELATEEISNAPAVTQSLERDISLLPSSSPKPSSITSSDVEVSSDPILRSTPPSSPLPPRSSPSVRLRRPILSFLKRRRAELKAVDKEPLSELDHNVPSPTKPALQKKRLVQMQLDLVSEIRKICKICGMEYVPSNAEDAALHRKFHAMNVGGVDFTKAVVERLRRNQIWTGGDGSFIAVIGRKDPLALRNRAVEVLKVVNTELAAIPIPEEDLWSQTLLPRSGHGRTQGSSSEDCPNGAQPTGDRFKTYLYIRGQKCIGACLAERIQEAYAVVDQDDAAERNGQVLADFLKRTSFGTDTALDLSQKVSKEARVPSVEFQSSSISIDSASSRATLGISRIWTSSLHRKQRIATKLLDSVRSDFLYGMTIEKNMIAFSQPTESGGQLARKWFKQQSGWHVYID